MAGSRPVNPAGLEACLDHAEKVGSGATAPVDNGRKHKRFAFHQDVPIVWLTELNRNTSVSLLHAIDISIGGVRLSGPAMLYPGSRGVLQLTKKTGEVALVGIEVVHTHYAGEMLYMSGCRFVPAPPDMLAARFVDSDGQMVLLRAGEKLPDKRKRRSA